MAGRSRGWLGIIVALAALAAWPGTAAATFPGKNGKIVFSANRDGASGIFTANPDGSGLTRLTPTDVTAREPAWSASGRKIVFAEQRGDGPFGYDIAVMNATGTGKRYLTDAPQDERSPTFAPDDSKVVFDRQNYPDPGSGVIVINSDGTGEQAITTNPVTGDRAPEWSPNGRKIVFTRERPGETVGGGGGTPSNPVNLVNLRQSHVWVVNSDGTGLRELTNDPQHTSGDYDPRWSPDSSRILFFRIWRSPGPTGPLLAPSASSTPAIMDASGTNVKPVFVATPGCCSLASRPTWSPDARQIAVTTAGDLVRGDYDAAASTVTNLQTVATDVFSAKSDWQSLPPRPKAPSLCELFGGHEQVSEPVPLKLSFCLR